MAWASPTPSPRESCITISSKKGSAAATIYDVGANKGQMTLFFASCGGPTGQVHAVEPAPDEFESLKSNVYLNHLSNVHLWNLALTEADGSATFRYASHRPSSGRLLREVNGYVNLDGCDELQVPTRSLDSLVAEGVPPPDLIKIDVEGAADLVLRGARRVLDSFAPAIYLELHGGREQAGVRDELAFRGYRIETLEGQLIDDVTRRWHNPLFCHKHGPQA